MRGQDGEGLLLVRVLAVRFSLECGDRGRVGGLSCQISAKRRCPRVH